MFGVGRQELLLIGLLLLIVFGPGKVGQMARDVGKFAYGARRSIEEFKAELRSVDHPNRETGEDEEQHEEQESVEDRKDARVR